MIFLIILGVIVYLAIGAFLGGLLFPDDLPCDSVFSAATWFLWPIMLVSVLLVSIMSIPNRLGEYVSKKGHKKR